MSDLPPSLYQINLLRDELRQQQDRFIETFDQRLKRVESFLAIYGLQGAAAIMLQPIEPGKEADPVLAQAAQTVITAAQGVMQRALEAAAEAPLADDTGDKGEGYLPITGTPTAKVTELPEPASTEPTKPAGLTFDQVDTPAASDSPPAQAQAPAQP